MMEVVEKEAEILKQEEPVAQEQQKPAIEPARSLQPLQTLHSSPSSTCKIPAQVANASARSPEVRDCAPREKRTPPIRMPPARVPLQARSENAVLRQKSPAKNNDLDRLQAKSSYPQKPQPLPMDPPPQRQPVQHTGTGPIRFKKPSLLRLPPKPTKPEPTPDENLDDFFVSNTQIQRELSPFPPPPTKPQLHPIPTVRPPTPPPLRPSPTANEDAAHLLSLISTQDLDFSFDLTPKPPSPTAATKICFCSSSSSSEEGEEDSFPDTELDSIVLEFSLESDMKSSQSSCTTSASQHHQPPHPKNHQPQSHSISHYSSSSDDAPTPTYLYSTLTDLDNGTEKACQDVQQHREALQGQLNGWDTFELELSTQDLLEFGS